VINLALHIKGRMMFQYTMLQRTFGHNKDDVIGGWRKLQTEELHRFFSSPII
jgi:hypothetical protein